MKTITRRDFLAVIAVAIITAAVTPAEAQAMPKKFRGCRSVTQNGVTYLLYKRSAIVTKCPSRASVTIPDSIKHEGSSYIVASIWDGAISRSTTRLVIKSKHLETIEDGAVWDRKSLTVIVQDRSVYQWITSTGAVSRVKYRG